MATTATITERDRAKQVIGEIVRQTGGLASKSELVRVFWRAHLLYADTQPAYLSFWPIVKAPAGPVIEDLDRLLGELVAEGVLRIDETCAGGTSAFLLKPTGESASAEALATDAANAVRQALAGGDQLPDLADFRSLRSWKETAEGRELHIYLDLDPISDAEYYERKQEIQQMAAVLKEVWR